jgi:membrane associated rhomboid family serine protease
MGIYDRNYYREDNDLNLAPSWNQRSAVSTLIIANVAVFVANLILSQQTFSPKYQGVVNNFLMLWDSDATRPLHWLRLVSYGFVHDANSIFHLFWNMLGLYFLGRAVEDRYGRSEFYRIYFITLVICSAVWLFKHAMMGPSANPNVLLGASGAVLCIEMLFVCNFPNARILLFVFPVPAWVLGVILVLTNIGNQPGTGIAYDVHFVGILCAVAYFFLGLNFSRLDDLRGLWRRTIRRLTGPKLKIHTESSAESDSIEADRILAKIHATGQDSLTAKEQKFLEKYSRAVRAKKDAL